MSYPDEAYHPLPQPEEIPVREREDAMGAYLMMFAALAAGLPLPMLNLVASVIYYYLHRKKSRFVRFHVLQSLWSQLPVTLLNGGLVVWAVSNFIRDENFSKAFMGLLVLAVLINIVYFVLSLIAAVKARQGRFFYFVFFGKLAYEQVFRVRYTDSDEEEETAYLNKPPF